jgi:hypothetical protein
MAKEAIFTAEWFPYYFERFEGSDRVARMSLQEEGAYHRAIRFAWRFGSVPSDPEVLAAQIQKRCTVKVAERVLSCFVPSDADPRKSVHPVLEQIRNEQKEKFLVKRKGGLASVKTRRKREKQRSSSTTSTEPDKTKIKTKNQRETEIGNLISDKISFQRLILRVREENFTAEDVRIVEIGVLYTLLQRNGDTDPIRSLRYFDPQIRQMITDCKTLASRSIDSLLERRRDQWWKGESNAR